MTIKPYRVEQPPWQPLEGTDTATQLVNAFIERQQAYTKLEATLTKIERRKAMQTAPTSNLNQIILDARALLNLMAKEGQQLWNERADYTEEGLAKRWDQITKLKVYRPLQTFVEELEAARTALGQVKERELSKVLPQPQDQQERLADELAFQRIQARGNSQNKWHDGIELVKAHQGTSLASLITEEYLARGDFEADQISDQILAAANDGTKATLKHYAQAKEAVLELDRYAAAIQDSMEVKTSVMPDALNSHNRPLYMRMSPEDIFKGASMSLLEGGEIIHTPASPEATSN